jgi:hypothetical protein
VSRSTVFACMWMTFHFSSGFQPVRGESDWYSPLFDSFVMIYIINCESFIYLDLTVKNREIPIES